MAKVYPDCRWLVADNRELRANVAVSHDSERAAADLMGPVADLSHTPAEWPGPFSVIRQQMQLLIAKRLEGFGRRERLAVIWQPAPDLPVRPETDSLAGA